jgi:ABC-type branched-subunit amino acid transport system substrate-binding protein
MSPGLLPRSRLLTGCACAVFVVLTTGAGCSTTPPAPTISGKTLTVYLSAPSNLAGNPAAQDVIDAEKLAFTQLSGQVKGYTLKLEVLTGNKISDNARSAIMDKSAVAYLGEVTPGTSVDSLGITNAQDVLQVSPTEAASVPTSKFESFSTYGRTFASMAPGQDVQGLRGGPAGKAFGRDFRSTYGHSPSSQAIFGYAATTAVLKALQKAGSGATDRGTIRDAFFGLKGAPLLAGSGGPELGTYTVNKDGTVTITPSPSH